MAVQKIGYIRVSSFDQNPERQLPEIEFDKKFVDYASGSNTNRPEFQSMMKYIREGDTLFVHSLDRLARNLFDLREVVETLLKKGVEVRFIKENLIFNGSQSPISMLTLSIMGAFAEFERSLILERQREGIELAKKRGVYKGRRKKLKETEVQKLLELSKQGYKKKKLAEMFNMSREAVYKYLRLANGMDQT